MTDNYMSIFPAAASDVWHTRAVHMQDGTFACLSVCQSGGSVSRYRLYTIDPSSTLTTAPGIQRSTDYLKNDAGALAYKYETELTSVNGTVAIVAYIQDANFDPTLNTGFIFSATMDASGSLTYNDANWIRPLDDHKLMSMCQDTGTSGWIIFQRWNPGTQARLMHWQWDDSTQDVWCYGDPYTNKDIDEGDLWDQYFNIVATDLEEVVVQYVSTTGSGGIACLVLNPDESADSLSQGVEVYLEDVPHDPLAYTRNGIIKIATNKFMMTYYGYDAGSAVETVSAVIGDVSGTGITYGSVVEFLRPEGTTGSPESAKPFGLGTIDGTSVRIVYGENIGTVAWTRTMSWSGNTITVNDDVGTIGSGGTIPALPGPPVIGTSSDDWLIPFAS